MKEETFEKLMVRLEQIVTTLESGKLPLEESITKFEEGMDLIKKCSEKLDSAEKKISLLMKKENNTHMEIPFNQNEFPPTND